MMRIESIKIELACPCCGGKVVPVHDNEASADSRFNWKASSKNGWQNGLERYACHYCKITMPRKDAALIAPAKTHAVLSFICDKHGGCQKCHRAIATLKVKYWLSEATMALREKTNTALICQSCFNTLANTCAISSVRPIPVRTVRHTLNAKIKRHSLISTLLRRGQTTLQNETRPRNALKSHTVPPEPCRVSNAGNTR